ncbi:MAG TPA: T9SS type A sorting domain-containing protein, partial [Rubricoccaceae bacterium]
HGALRVAAWQGLVAARRATGDAAGALAAADALELEGGPAVVQAETARVYLHGEAGDEAAALAALASLEALAPESVEAELARAFLGVEAPSGGRGAGAPAVQARGTSAMEAVSEGVDFTVGPNPAASSASLTVTLAEAADVTVVVYDLLGRAVRSALSGPLAAGAHRAEIDASALAPGVYVVRAVVNTPSGAVVRTARLTVAR